MLTDTFKAVQIDLLLLTTLAGDCYSNSRKQTLNLQINGRNILQKALFKYNLNGLQNGHGVAQFFVANSFDKVHADLLE